MKFQNKLSVSLILVVMFFSFSFIANGREITKTFEAKKLIKVNTVSGHCTVEKSDSDQIEVTFINETKPRGALEPRFRELGNILKITEEINGSSSGFSEVILSVPESIDVDFSSASGGFSVRDLSGRFTTNTASGDIDIKDCKGEFDINTASGNINAIGIVLESESEFGTASGTVRVGLATSPEYDLNIGSASGRAVLKYNGNPLKGCFELSSKYRDGKIDAPFDFDDEEVYYKHKQKYIKKTFARGGDEPYITIGTASGRASLKK